MKIFKSKTKDHQAGYTIIETMIAVSIFLIITVIAMGALLNANLLYQKSRDMRSIVDNLSFVMEDIGRNLRNGYDYHCIDNGNLGAVTPYSCPLGGEGVSFKSSDGVGQWTYYVGPNGSGKDGIFKVVDGVTVQLTPSEVDIDPSSVFIVVGAEPPPGDSRQPFVTIKIIGRITYKDFVTPFTLQTSVSQRAIDI